MREFRRLYRRIEGGFTRGMDPGRYNRRLFLGSSNPLGATTGHRPVFETVVVRSHSRTLDEDVFVPFLQWNRKRRLVVQTGQGCFGWKETTDGPRNLEINVFHNERGRYKPKIGVPGLAGPQTQKPDFLQKTRFETVLSGTAHSQLIEPDSRFHWFFRFFSDFLSRPSRSYGLCSSQEICMFEPLAVALIYHTICTYFWIPFSCETTNVLVIRKFMFPLLYHITKIHKKRKYPGGFFSFFFEFITRRSPMHAHRCQYIVRIVSKTKLAKRRGWKNVFFLDFLET